jgi:hypothetical protein
MANKIKEKKVILPKVVIEDEPWIMRYWRPMMAWQYFVVCICDFIIFPSFAMYYASKYGVAENFKWDPITLASGGFYHIAMGIIVGVAAYSRGQENLLRTRLFAGMNPPPPMPSSSEFCDDDVYMDEGLDPPAHPTFRTRKGG